MRYRILIAACLVIAALAACNTKEGAQEEPNKAPKVEFSVKETALDVLVESSVGFNATIVEGKNVKCSWTVDGELVELSFHAFAHVGIQQSGRSHHIL